MNFDSSVASAAVLRLALTRTHRPANWAQHAHQHAAMAGGLELELEETSATLPARGGGGKLVDHGGMVDRGGTTGETR